jgi:hypothetical protein
MMTDALIDRLARDLHPVRPLPHPAVRAGVWIVGVAAYLVLVAAPFTSAVDIAANRTGGLRFIVPQLLAMATSAMAAAAAFASVVPGYSRHYWRPAAAAAAAWAVSLAIAGSGQWAQGRNPALPNEWVCVALIVASGTPPMLVGLRMLQRGVAFNPWLTAALSALATTSLANIGACLSHPHTNYALTLLWHGATIVTLVAVCTVLGPRALSRAAAAPVSRDR